MEFFSYGGLCLMLAISMVAFALGHAVGWSSRGKEEDSRREMAQPGVPPAVPADAPPAVPVSSVAAVEPLIFGRHCLAQLEAEPYHKSEPWQVCMLSLYHSFNVPTKEQAIELMAKVDAYMEARLLKR